MKTHLTLLLSALSALLLASCSSSQTDNIATISSQKSVAPTGDLESQTLFHVNRYRATKGLPALKAHSGLQQLASVHSNNMQQRDDMSHFDFKKRAKTAQKKHQMGAMSENLQRSWGIVPTGHSIVTQWKNSPKHRDNMEGNFSHAGMAITRDGNNIFSTLLLGQGVGANTPAGPPSPFLIF